MIKKIIRALGRWPTERWISLSSMIIALSALGLSVNEFSAERIHDELTVRPRLICEFAFNDKGAGWVCDNIGMGPARLRGFKITVGGSPLPAVTDSGTQSLHEMLVKALGIPQVYVTFFEPRAGELYKPGEMSDLLWVKPGPAADLLTREWKRVQIETCYCSIYDECWIFGPPYLVGPTGEPPRDDNCKDFEGLPKSLWWQG